MIGESACGEVAAPVDDPALAQTLTTRVECRRENFRLTRSDDAREHERSSRLPGRSVVAACVLHDVGAGGARCGRRQGGVMGGERLVDAGPVRRAGDHRYVLATRRLRGGGRNLEAAPGRWQSHLWRLPADRSPLIGEGVTRNATSLVFRPTGVPRLAKRVWSAVAARARALRSRQENRSTRTRSARLWNLTRFAAPSPLTSVGSQPRKAALRKARVRAGARQIVRVQSGLPVALRTSKSPVGEPDAETTKLEENR